MRFLFKTTYDQDIRLFPHDGYVRSYGVLAAFLLCAPFLITSYLQSQLVFVMIYSIVGVSLMILTGFTGQGSLGHAAFLAIGAYVSAYLQKAGMPFVGIGIIPLDIALPLPIVGTVKFSMLLPHVGYLVYAALSAAMIGALVGLPAVRLHGIYLLLATMSFAFIVEEVLARWVSVTNGNAGLRVGTLTLLGLPIPANSNAFYYLCLGVLALVVLGTLNIMRSPTGRAFIAIRDSEIAASSMGIEPAAYKIMAFALSAGITGLAGALYAHKLTFISPEMFTLQLSIEFIMVVIIGGTLGLQGAVLGSIFIVMLDPLLAWLKDDLPSIAAFIIRLLSGSASLEASSEQFVSSLMMAPGLKGLIYGFIIVLFIQFEPQGIYGRWLKIKLFFDLFPTYKKATFKRQKMYMKSERNR